MRGQRSHLSFLVFSAGVERTEIHPQSEVNCITVFFKEKYNKLVKILGKYLNGLNQFSSVCFPT